MKPVSVIIDLAAEQGGNCDLTKPNQTVKTDNDVKIIGYTDFPSRMAAQSSTLYSTNIRHMLDDLTPKNNGKVNINLQDDVIRGALVSHKGKLMFPPPAPKIAAIGKQTTPKQQVEPTAEEKAALEQAAIRKSGQQQGGLLLVGGLFMLIIGNFAPASFMQHFIVFALACFVGYQVIWNVSHAALGFPGKGFQLIRFDTVLLPPRGVLVWVLVLILVAERLVPGLDLGVGQDASRGSLTARPHEDLDLLS